MNLPENDYQILKLTNAFYSAYPNPPYTEILKKNQRAYNCLLFQSHYDYFICIPYRSEITHKYAYHFTSTERAKLHRSGLDYSKIVIIDRAEYIDSVDAIIDKDEFNETIINLEKIKKEALKFVEDYILHITGIKIMHICEFNRRYAFSPLRYFHNILKNLKEAEKLTEVKMKAPSKIKGYDEVTYQVIKKDKFIQVNYRKDDDNSITIRKAVYDKDISGDYNEYKNIKKATIKGYKVKFQGNGKTYSLATWTKGKYSFSVGVYNNGKGISLNQIKNIIARVK